MTRKSRKPDWKVIGLVVVPIVVAIIGLIPTMIDIIERQQASPRGPDFYDFSACEQPCDGSNAKTVFEDVDKIYTQWKYRNIPVDAVYVRVWTMNGKEWVRYSCRWPGPTQGSELINLTEPKGLSSGIWEMTISINGTVLMREKIQILGEEYDWEPIGEVNRCY
jgi:hypothetical protein